jgi:hypothetical protein
MEKIKILLLIIIVLISGCGDVLNKQKSGPVVTASPIPKTSTSSVTPTLTHSLSPTVRPTSTTKPSPTVTAKTASSSTPTEEPTSPSQQPETLPDGRLLLTYGKLDIVGSKTFIDKTSEALSLLKQKCPYAHHKIQTYVGLIEQGEHSGMWAFENPPRYEVGQRTVDSSITWYASTIAHDATHSELFHNYLEQHGAPVPDEAWADVEAEQFCIAYQLQVLKAIGGTEYEIEYLESQTGTHCDVDSDGDCDWNDYENRDW